MRTRDVAVVGISCIFPGSDNYEEYWLNLAAGKCSIKEIAEDRWDIDQFYSSDPSEKNKAWSKWCGQINTVYDFDHKIFNITPKEAESMDPQQRLLLQETWHCIEDAGIAFERLKEQTTSVFVGAMNCDYRQELYSDNLNVDGYFTLGSFENMLANRISHCFGLKGNSTTLNAACASSFVAIDYAVSSLADGSSDYAIAAAANLNINPWKYISFSKAKMLSPSGLCQTFDAAADGYVPGDGIAVLLLQRLETARRHGNKIYGVIKGVSVVHNGGALTITAPLIDSQVKVISQALKKAHIKQERINYIEAHGTGTSLGDPIETAALKKVFARNNRENRCYIGSVKTNIGHLEAASGMAGIIKVLMMMKHHKIPGTINTKGDNAILALNEAHFILNAKTADWHSIDGGPLCAGISSFGFGGTNAHVIIEEYIEDRTFKPDRADQILILSAGSMEAAAQVRNRWNIMVANHKSEHYSDLLKTALNVDKNQKYRYARIVGYGDTPDVEQAAVFEFTAKCRPQLMIFDSATGACGKHYTLLRNKYYRYDEIVCKLSAMTGKHQRKLDSGADTGAICKAHYNVDTFIFEYGFALFLKEIGVPMRLISWDQTGLFVLLAIAGIYKPEDIIAYLAGKKSLSKCIQKYHNSIIIHAADGLRILPFSLDDIEDNIGMFMKKELSGIDAALLNEYIKKYYLLISSQYTFRNSIMEWEKILKMRYQLSLKDLIAGSESWYKKYLLMAIYDCMRKIKDKWEMEMDDVIEDIEIRYFLTLIGNHILSIKELTDCIAGSFTIQTAKLESRAQDYLTDNDKFRVISGLSVWHEDMEELSRIRYTGHSIEADAQRLSSYIDDFDKNIVELWLRGYDLRFDLLYREGSYQKQNIKKQYFLKNHFYKHN